jgi:hypothetical protein
MNSKQRKSAAAARQIAISGRPDIRPNWKDYDFSYLEHKPKEIQRLATWYEYARESDDIIDAVHYKDVDEDWYKYYDRIQEVYFHGELEFLESFDSNFPKLSFQEILRRDLKWRPLVTEKVKLTQLPSRLLVNDEEFVDFVRTHGSHVVFVPWELPKGEIVRQFAEALETAWPWYDPASKRGRRGVRQTVGGADLLHQLAVYRYQQSGGTFVGRPPYLRALYGSSSIKGWNKAFAAAEARIADLTISHIFA